MCSIANRIKYLVIAEKKALAEAIAEAIPGSYENRKTPGVIEKGDYVITWASGHLLTLKAPEDYDPALKKWDIDTLPIYFENWEMKIKESDGVGEAPSVKVNRIGNMLQCADAVIHAGDPDEEGQQLIDELLTWFHYRGPVYRLATADTSKSSLYKALQNMDDNNNHVQDGYSAYARSVADLMVGVNISRFYTVLNKTLLTVGRVQSPTLGLVVQRDMQIENHVKTVYYEIFADCRCNDASQSVIHAKYEPAKNDPMLTDGMILDRSYAHKKSGQLLGFQGKSTVTSSEVKEQPPLPFNLGKLQSYCASKFGYSLEDTMSITQSLRDKYNAISYNRTDVQYLPESYFKEAPETIARVCKNLLYRNSRIDTSIHSRCFNDKYIEAHFAIIPQNKGVDILQMTERERNVYTAICKYYMIQFMPPAVKRKNTFTCELEDGGKLIATSTEILDKGYLELLSESAESKATPLQSMQPGDYEATITQANVEEKETKPPAYYTQATLNEDMSRIAKYVDNPKVRQLLLDKDKDKKQENGSIGTVATRAGIISGLIKKGFLQEEKKGKTTRLTSTELGRELYRILPDYLRKPDLTAYWWVIQEDIRHGNKVPADLSRTVLDMIKRILQSNPERIKPSVANPARMPLGKCPWCDGEIIEGKKGFGCSKWKEGCKFVLWKETTKGPFRSTTFTSNDVKKLLDGKAIYKAKLSKKDGDTFGANVTLSNEVTPYGAKLNLSFDNLPKRRKKKDSA